MLPPTAAQPNVCSDFVSTSRTSVATFLPPTVAQPKVCSDFLSSNDGTTSRTSVATFLPPTVAQPKVCSDFLSSTMAQRVERLWRFSCLQRWHSLRSVVIFFPQRWHNESNVCGDFLASNGGTAKGAGAPKHEVAVKLPLCVNHLVTGRCQS